MEIKKLSLLHLTRGLQLLDRIQNVDEGADVEMVAVYLASPDILRKAKTNPSVLDSLLEQAGDMDAEEAAGIVADFFERCLRYRADTIGSLPAITEEIRTKVLKAQGQTS
ncbi:hypothetical protein [Geothrix sp. 21YS21S-2]|uniref:hypothetical protein n=1 Tax=Geothrix sp. 21YS21S-2 TaxID=3068893 RepID=UPI0027B936B9|nr:hypothetical protein [Geothrix sp. 21YS21S-2]